MQYDVIVLGGGTAGLVTASGCARLGRRVALIDQSALGGDCLWTGCVPTKALVASAKLAHQMRHAGAWGLPESNPAISPREVMESMRARRKTISRHDDPEKFRQLGIDVIEGHAELQEGLAVAVGGRTLLGRDLVIATGSRTSVPPIDGLEDAGYLDHKTFLDRDVFPASVVILGGGAIGVEFAQIFARFGVRVTLVEMLETILVKEDEPIVTRLRTLLAQEGIEIITGHAVRAVRRSTDGKLVTIEPTGGGAPRTLVAEEIFIASGRRGNTEDLGLEKAGVKVERSWVIADRFLRTTAPRIWTCGDVHGALQFTHVAAYEAVKLVRNILFPGKSAVDYTHIPWGVYTDPEIAHIGLTEREARETVDGVRVYEVEMHDVDRAVVDRTDAGLLRLVCDARGAILGAHALCANASTVIEEVVLARRNGMKVTELAQRISAYPSLADSVQKAAAQHYQSIASGPLGRLARLVAKWSQ